MRDIKPIVYENLTVRQRIIASIEATARNDEEEERRLVSTCPRKIYKQSDNEYSDQMVVLMGMALATECDLRGYALSYYFTKHIYHEKADIFLQCIADTHEAWNGC